MPIAFAEAAYVPAEKLKDYLLNPMHPVGGPKARWFLSRGFESSDPSRLGDALVELVRKSDEFTATDTPFGQKHVVRGELACPDGRRERILTVWILETGSDRPRLVTAHPAESAA